MSAKAELEKLQVMRKELEAESLSLISKQRSLENCVLSLEEQVATQELEKEKTLVEDLRSRNKAAKSAIAQLEARKKELETRLEQTAKTLETAPEAQKASETPAHSEEKETVEQTEVSEENDVMTVVESEEMVEAQENQQNRKKFKIF